MKFRNPAAITALAMFVVCAASDSAIGQLLTDVQHARSIAQKPLFRTGSFVKNPQTLAIHDLQTLFRRTTGGVRAETALKYGGDFDTYWRASFSGRSGKAFEAYEVYRANRRLQRLGRAERLLVTAVEGAPHDPADVVMISGTGRVKKRFQLKLGSRAAIDSLDDPKYVGMTIITRRDSLGHIQRDLAKAAHKAKIRGRPLSPHWQKVEKALAEGRLTDEMLPGFQTRTLKKIERVAKKYTARLFETVSRGMPRTSRIMASAGRGTARVGLRAGSVTLKYAGKAFAAADFAFVGYQTHSDWRRYSTGEMGEGVLACKVALRTGEVAIAVLLLSPDPGSKVIVVGIVASLALAGTDVSLDAFVDAKRERTRRLLETIDRDERFDAVRGQLMAELRAL